MCYHRCYSPFIHCANIKQVGFPCIPGTESIPKTLSSILPLACHSRKLIKTGAESSWVCCCLYVLPLRLQPVTLFGTITLMIHVTRY